MPTNDTVWWKSDNVASGSGSTALSTYTTTPYRISDMKTQWSVSSLFGNDGKCTYDDIGQGSVGNCWFMAAAASLTQQPGLMEKAFGTHDQFNLSGPRGFYDVNFYLLGVPITIRVDDYIPTYNGYSNTLSAKFVNGGAWMPLLEKGMAKLYGNYNALIAGNPDEAFQVLSGLPTSSISIATMTDT